MEAAEVAMRMNSASPNTWVCGEHPEEVGSMTARTADGARLVARADPVLSQRFSRSARSRTGAGRVGFDVPGWLARRIREQAIRVERIPLTGLDGWSFHEATGNLGHRGGRFFTIEGLHVVTHDPSLSSVPREWQQPIIVQPE